jgi:hypothetical protein
LGIARPAWFDIYREFPGHGKEQIGQPCRGTVAVGTQPEWLAQNYKRLVAVLYFIGDVACFQGDPQTGRPGECFYARTFPLNVQSHELVQLWTKHGGLIEDDKSLKVTPPIAVRGHLDPYFLDTQRVEHAALVELLFRNSEHRLITACLHYFLAQMGDPMIVSFEQDYANYCASLEAAFDIRQGDAGDAIATGQVTTPPVASTESGVDGVSSTAPSIALHATVTGSEPPTSPPTASLPTDSSSELRAQPPGSASVNLFEKVVDEVIQVYGDTAKLRDYARGLYTCRSIHDHGLSDFDPVELQKYRHVAYTQFLARRRNYSVCRAICRDVILRQLWKQPGGSRTAMQKMFGYTDSASDLLRKFFYSQEIWQTVKTRAREQGAGKKIGALTEPELEAFRDMAIAFVAGFDWQAVEPVEKKDVLKVIQTMLMANATSVTSVPAASDVPSMHDLGIAFDHKTDPERELSIWSMQHEQYLFDLHCGDRTALIIAVAWKASSYFTRR